MNFTSSDSKELFSVACRWTIAFRIEVAFEILEFHYFILEMASNVVLRTNLIILILLVIFLSYPEQTSAQTKLSLKGFFANTRQQNAKDLKTQDISGHENRFLGDTPGAIFVNVISVISGIFTIWGWIESREKKHDKGEESETDELMEEWNTQLDNLNSRMEDFKNSMKQLVCRFDYVHAKSKTISQECWQFIQQEPKQHYHSKTNIVTQPAKLPYKRNNIEKKHTLLETDQFDSLQRLLKATGN